MMKTGCRNLHKFVQLGDNGLICKSRTTRLQYNSNAYLSKFTANRSYTTRLSSVSFL